MSFGAQVKTFASQYSATLHAVIDDARAEISHRIQARTPVDTGNAQRNWEASTQGDTYYFLNPLKKTPYIRRLEYGWSPQAPSGMVRISAAEWPDIVQLAVRVNTR